MINKEQIRAARALLHWSQQELADHCGNVSAPTIKLIELGKTHSTDATLGSVQHTLEDAGIEFLPQSGVRFRDDQIKIIEKQNANDNIYLRLLDDIYYTLIDKGGEVLISNADNKKSSQQVIDRQINLRRAGIKMRFLVRSDDSYFIYPLKFYRYLPKGFVINNPVLVYDNKYAVIIQDEITSEPIKILVIKNTFLSEIQRQQFEFFWKEGLEPEHTSATETFE